MSLILDHINGDRSDRIENLQIVCPNCNATLETHCRGKNYKNEKYSEYDICVCGESKKKTSKNCIKCYYQNRKKVEKEKPIKNRRKVDRPNHEILQSEIEKYGYTKTGRKYGVSDNSIRKWIKTYEKQLKIE